MIRNVIPSAATITPDDQLTHISGTAAIANITPPSQLSLVSGAFAGFIFLVADGAWSTTTTGNIANAVSATAGQVYIAVWEGAKWYLK